MAGTVGNLVFYTMNGKSYARSIPSLSKKRKKEMAVTNRAIIFGTVSRHGTAILSVLQGFLRFRFTLATYNGVRGWMRNQYAPNHTATEWPLTSQYNNTCQLNSNGTN